MIDRIFHPNEWHRTRFVAAFARSLKNERVLDAGAGRRRYAELFKYCDYWSADKEPSEGLDFVGELTALPARWAGRFDAVICCEVLEHHPDPHAVLCELARVMKRGGQLLLTVPLTSGIHMEPDHYYGGFSKFWCREFLRRAGFIEVRVRPNGGFFWLYGQESQRFASMLPRPFNWLAWPWFRIVMPLACYFLDRLDDRKDFSFGYLVQAIKP